MILSRRASNKGLRYDLQFPCKRHSSEFPSKGDLFISKTLSIPQIDSEQFEKILRYIKSGIESNATLECGGDRFGSKGYFIQPTVFSNVQVCNFSNTNQRYRISFVQKIYDLIPILPFSFEQSGRHVDRARRDLRTSAINLEVQVSFTQL